MMKSDRNYAIRFSVSMGTYAALLLIALVLARLLPDSPWRFPLMLIPVPALLLIIRAVLLYLREADELQTRILLESMGIGLAGGSLLTFTWGLMQTVGAPDIAWTFVFAVYAACWLLGRWIAGRRYR